MHQRALFNLCALTVAVMRSSFKKWLFNIQYVVYFNLFTISKTTFNVIPTKHTWIQFYFGFFFLEKFIHQIFSRKNIIIHWYRHTPSRHAWNSSFCNDTLTTVGRNFCLKGVSQLLVIEHLMWTLQLNFFIIKLNKGKETYFGNTRI